MEAKIIYMADCRRLDKITEPQVPGEYSLERLLEESVKRLGEHPYHVPAGTALS